LRRRVNTFREHEYAVLLYSLGALGASLPTLAPTVRDKVHRRASRVCRHLTSRSVSNGLMGLSRCGESWEGLGQEARDSWCEALCPTAAVGGLDSSSSEGCTKVALEATDAAATGPGSGPGPRPGPDVGEQEKRIAPHPRGLGGMNRAEVSQVVLALRALGADASQLPSRINLALQEATQRTGFVVL